MTDLSKAADTLGSAAVIPGAPAGARMLHNQRLGRVEILAPQRIDKGFLYGALRTDGYRRQIVATATGTTVKHTSPTRIGEAVIPLPPIEEQRRIAGVFVPLDEKIASNRRASWLLDRIGEAYFQHWFTRGGKWDAVPVEDRVPVLLGGTPARSKKRFWTGGTVGWIASAKANDFRILEPTAYITEEAVAKSATKLMPSGTTVVAITGATMGKVSRLEINACANQSIVGLPGTQETPNAFLFYWLRSAVPELLTRQTGAAQQHVNKSDVGSLRMPVADRASLNGLVAALDPLLAQVGSLLREAEILRAIRDALLPRLVSGTLRVRDMNRLEAVGSTPVAV